MLRYPSTKQILTVAVLSALLAGCGKESKKATADNNANSVPAAERPEAAIAPVELGTQVELTESSDVARQQQAVAIAAIALTTTLNLDSGSTAVRQALGAFSTVPKQDSATGALSTVLGGTTQKCSKGGDYMLTLLMGEGENVRQNGKYNHEEVHFDADFNKCDLGGTKISGGLGMTLTLGIAELINTAQFRLETGVIAQNLEVDNKGKKYTADGAAGYKFYTNNGYEFVNELYADQFDLDIGMGINAIDLKLKQVNNTATNDWTLSVGAKYQAGKTYVEVATGASAPLAGKGYGYPSSGQLNVYTAVPNASNPKANSVSITVRQSLDLGKHPTGSYIYIEIFTKDGEVDTALGYSWSDIEGAVNNYLKTNKLELPQGTPDEGVEN